jgi:hypothetical protein
MVQVIRYKRFFVTAGRLQKSGGFGGSCRQVSGIGSQVNSCYNDYGSYILGHYDAFIENKHLKLGHFDSFWMAGGNAVANSLCGFAFGVLRNAQNSTIGTKAELGRGVGNIVAATSPFFMRYVCFGVDTGSFYVPVL